MSFISNELTLLAGCVFFLFLFWIVNMLTDSPPMIQNNIVFDNIFDTEDTKALNQNKERASPVYFCHSIHPERWNVTNGKYICDKKLYK